MPAEEHRNYMAPLGVDIRKIVKPILGKKGFGEFDILTSWSDIVGDKIANFSHPLRLAFPKGKRCQGVLHIMVNGGAFAAELCHNKMFVIDKINTFFGYLAVEDIKITQSLHNFDIGVEQEEPKEDNTTLPSGYQSILNQVEDSDLQASLAKLAKAIISSDKD